MVDVGKYFLKALGIDSEFLNKSTKEFYHVHEMLKRLHPDDHERIHEHTLKVTDLSGVPESYRDVAISGSCVYNLVSWLYIQQFGMEGYQLSRHEFLGDMNVPK